MIDWKVIRDWTLIFFVFGIGLYIIIFLRSEASMCLANPTLYGIQQLQDVNKAQLQCSCMFNSSYVASFTANETGLFPVQKKQDSLFVQPNSIPNLTNFSWTDK